MEITDQGIDLRLQTYQDKCRQCKASVKMRYHDLSGWTSTYYFWYCPSCGDRNLISTYDISRHIVKGEEISESDIPVKKSFFSRLIQALFGQNKDMK